MPNYYQSGNYPNAWWGIYPPAYSNYPTYTTTSFQTPQLNQQYMIQVDGEIGARAWQMPNNLPPNTVVPLWDMDGYHVYFRSIDVNGRPNPLRKGRVIFEDEQQHIPEQTSSVSGSIAVNPEPDMSQYVKKEDLDQMKNEIMQSIASTLNVRTNQNGSQQQGNNNRGGNQK